MGPQEYYFIAVNGAGFLLFALHRLLVTRTEHGQLYPLLVIAALLGGTPGILLAILLMDRKAEKDTMMFKVFVLCLLAVQIILFLFLRGGHHRELTFAFGGFFAENPFLTAYLLAVNIVTFLAFAADKFKAVTHRSRIRIVTLLALSFLGGAPGGLLAMGLFRHKIRKNYFTVGLPMMLAVQVLLLFYLMNA